MVGNANAGGGVPAVDRQGPAGRVRRVGRVGWVRRVGGGRQVKASKMPAWSGVPERARGANARACARGGRIAKACSLIPVRDQLTPACGRLAGCEPAAPPEFI